MAATWNMCVMQHHTVTCMHLCKLFIKSTMHFMDAGGAYERLSTHDHDAFLDELIAYMHSPQLAADERRREQQEADEDAMYAGGW